ncbi:alpha-amylase [Scytonema sp. HK-05]|uniref:alpha-amylase family glycosyl hydrolase n=1 Tax=Scytonema sp. HK-05 TaxID=1137095 RepID=UPI000936F171|nr:alpha-amylase family glycosyl hydrolase [Scytonema sp. HK-05]OKH60547.1 alpha-amylase [Scytonema sp. HK-05]BAY45936.1 alpha-amylase [Scytonema sp. HK-05]
MVERQLSKLDLESFIADGDYYPSPIAWEDQVFYFMMLDRFSDDKEIGYKDIEGNVVPKSETRTTSMFKEQNKENSVKTPEDAERWRKAGVKYVGGNLKGLKSKIGYLKRLGVTTIWISPIFKQIRFQETYHGYGIQNFLEIEPRFGTHKDLKELVKTAHANGIYVILDIILNHTGNVFSYAADRYWTQDGNGNWFLDSRWDGNPYQVKGFNDKEGHPTIPFQKTDPDNPSTWPDLDAAVWPVEFQDPSFYTQKGHINNWDHNPEYLEGDFSDLKDVKHGQGNLDNYRPSAALTHLCKAYAFWIADTDIDGFRIDTVKHMEVGATRFFASVIHEFAQSIGKENFFLVGEITGGRINAFRTLEQTGLDAALGIDDIPDKLEYLIKGYRNPRDYFSLFRNSELVDKESHIWFRNKVVTMFDDHDQVRKGENKGRFCADRDASKVVLNALALNATTLGIPCIYYGTEQGFDGSGRSDQYLREAMFGGEFGAFRSRGVHFFNEENPIYQELAEILKIRSEKKVLRRGRQYLRAISGDGQNFGLPEMIGGQIRSVVPWSRVFSLKEMLLAINTDYYQPQTAWVTLDNQLHNEGDLLKCIYSTDKEQIGKQIPVESRNGKSIKITVPAAGFIIYE